MLLGTKKTLYDHITEALLDKPLSAVGLGIYLDKKKIPATVQGIYKTLRELIAEDIVVKQKKEYLISNVWREKISNLVSKRQGFSLAPRETVSYKFKKLDHTDAFWKHAYADLANQIGHFPAFIFMPHEFWIHVPGRRASELEYFAEPKKINVPMYTTIGGTTIADKSTKTEITHNYHPVHLDARTPFNRRDHIVVLGPYVILTRVSGSLAKAIDHTYETSTDELQLTEKLETVFKKPTTVAMIVEHNEHKAKKLRKRLSTNFHIPKELREKFDLF